MKRLENILFIIIGVIVGCFSIKNYYENHPEALQPRSTTLLNSQLEMQIYSVEEIDAIISNIVERIDLIEQRLSNN